MSNLVAWGDESVRTQGQDVPAYYMGVWRKLMYIGC